MVNVVLLLVMLGVGLTGLSPAEWCTTTRPETVGVSLPE